MSKIIIKNATRNNLKNISLEIPLNKIVTFIGKSGSGKSSLVVGEIFEESFNKSSSHTIPLKTILFKQVSSSSNKKSSVSVFLFKRKNSCQYINECFKKNYYKLNPEDLIYIVNALKLNKIGINNSIQTVSLSQYNKLRFLKMLLINKESDILIIDELCSGLNKNDIEDIFKVYKYLIAKGFSILAVEHTPYLISKSDYIVELGPGSGINGGNIVFAGDINDFIKTQSYKNMLFKYKVEKYKNTNSKKISVKHININQFKNFNIEVPLSGITVVCGGSASGKTSLIEALYKAFDKSTNSWKNKGGIDGEILGKSYIRRPYIINQDPIGSNIKSTPATYSGIFDLIRKEYVNCSENENKYKLSLSDFSFNSLGKCLKCNGNGYNEITRETENILIKCDKCNGNRYKSIIQEIKISNKSISDLFNMTVLEAKRFSIDNNFSKTLINKLEFLESLGLDYLSLGQPSITLSGGESQRLKISKELSKKLGDRCLFLLDSPSKGLYYKDTDKVYEMLNKLIEKNNFVIVVDNNPNFILKATNVIVLGDNKILYQGNVSNFPKNLLKFFM